ncbi:MAG: exodeoxyribonuclease VII small subunit [Clostridiales bacterium]|nr:exodeoxyribonuclease VII small subunit [Clostridiales bacterium]
MESKMTYEQAMKRLEEIVKRFEEETLPLDESMKLFEEGTKLSVFCNQCLDEAEQKLIELTEEEADG